MTKHGKLIADVVLASHDHPTAEEIYLRIREGGTPISLATVYNNLKTLVEDGTLLKLSMDGAPDRFDKPTHHQHLICDRCGQLADVTVRDLTQMIREDTGLDVLSYDMRIRYVCPSCRKALKQEKNEQD